MTTILQKIKLNRYKILFAALCIIALIGYKLPAINVHLSFLDMTYTFSISLATDLNEFASPSDQFDFDDTDLSDLLAEIQIIDIMDDVIRTAIFSAASYIVVLILLLAVIVLTLLGKFRPLKVVILFIALVLFIVSGAVIMTVPETTNDILADVLGNFNGELVSFILSFTDITEIVFLELGAGYWLTLITLAVMLLLDGAVWIRAKHRSCPITKFAQPS